MLPLELTFSNQSLQLTAHHAPAPPRAWADGQLQPRFDPQFGAIWSFMRPRGVPCYNLGLLAEIDAFDQAIADCKGIVHCDGSAQQARYYVVASAVPQAFNYGGDLALFARLATARDRDALMHYAKACVNNIHRRLCGFDQMIATMSVVQGDALGGGFETALATQIIVAERSAKMGFPEILFNLFPGMGAYSFLLRRVGRRLTEDMIYSGAIYGASELADLGIVDALAEDGQGIEVARDFMREHARRNNGYLGMLRARTETTPVTHDELMRITTAWVDSALRLEARDLRMMQRLVSAQSAKMKMQPKEAAAQTATRS